MRIALALALALVLTGRAAFADEAKPPIANAPDSTTCELYANLMKQQRDALEVALANALAEVRRLKTEPKDAK